MKNYILKLSKPYLFEGETYTEIDLSGIEELTCRQMQSIEKKFLKINDNPILAEMTLRYSVILAAEATRRPIEFFDNLPAGECGRLKNMVTNFLYPSGTESEKAEQLENV